MKMFEEKKKEIRTRVQETAKKFDQTIEKIHKCLNKEFNEVLACFPSLNVRK